MPGREMQSQSSSDRLRATDLSNPDSFKTRRGKVGGYQDDFSKAEVEAIERHVNETLRERFGYCEREPALGK